MTQHASTIEVPFLRVKRSKADAFTSIRSAASRARPWRVAQMLALAHAMRDLLDRGVVRGYAELAHLAGVTRPRVTQLLDLTLLAPDIQEELLFAETSGGRERITERAMRAVVRSSSWQEQRRSWAAMGYAENEPRSAKPSRSR